MKTLPSHRTLAVRIPVSSEDPHLILKRKQDREGKDQKQSKKLMNKGQTSKNNLAFSFAFAESVNDPRGLCVNG